MFDSSQIAMQNGILIDARNVGIYFQRTVAERNRGIKNSFSSIFKILLNRAKKEKFWALRNINFTLKRGEVVGIVGPNGAGKSTLLKILAQVLIPDEGSILVNGKVSSLLALGSGFMPGLNGRENIYLNGMYMGMTKSQVDEVYDNIVSFSGLMDFIETPIKYYSMGMKARLGFSVAVHTRPEILVIDEVLGAGDKQFQLKARKKMQDFLTSAKGIVIVSHNVAQIENFCTNCLWIERGEVRASGPAPQVIKNYTNS
jgi:ABC-type polysaccharide/polyol phosphate transport system ATPase subunit